MNNGLRPDQKKMKESIFYKAVTCLSILFFIKSETPVLGICLSPVLAGVASALTKGPFCVLYAVLCRVVCGCSSVGRAQASQAWGREFESRCPLHGLLTGLCIIAPVILGFFWLYHLYRVNDVGGFESGLAHFFLCLFQGDAKTNKFLRDNTDMSGSVVEKVQAFAETLLPSIGLELVEVQFRLEGHGWVLRLFIDGKEGITVDHCARVSREVSDFLEVEDLIDYAYHLEVSSPGLERSLHGMNDFQRSIGKKAKLKLREDVENQKVLIGDIVRAEDETVELVLEDGTKCQVAFEQIRKARLSL